MQLEWQRFYEADVLDVRGSHKTWCFVWPGRMQIETEASTVDVEPLTAACPSGTFRIRFDHEPSRPRAFAGPVARARAYIEAHWNEDFDLQTLSREAGLDRCRLCRVFRQAIGVPPLRFRAHLRIAQARKLLAAGVDCIAVAHQVGFCDQSHLNRWFKELTGTTPGAYAAA